MDTPCAETTVFTVFTGKRRQRDAVDVSSPITQEYSARNMTGFVIREGRKEDCNEIHRLLQVMETAPFQPKAKYVHV